MAPGRRPSDDRQSIAVKLPPWLHEHLSREAESLGMTVSSYLRMLLTMHASMPSRVDALEREVIDARARIRRLERRGRRRTG